MSNNTDSNEQQGEALEPCRFCGKEAKGFWDGPYLHVSGPPDGLHFYSVVCNGCCSTASYESKERAVEKWNTRSRASVAAVEGDVVDIKRRLAEIRECLEWRETKEQGELVAQLNRDIRFLLLLRAAASSPASPCAECEAENGWHRTACSQHPRFAAPLQPEDEQKQPLCPVHKSLDEQDELALEIGNNCVACSLHERTELLNILEPFANPNGTQDSVTVLRNALTATTSPSETAVGGEAKHHKHCSIWTVTTSGKRNPCDCICQCTHSMFQHIRPGEHAWYEDCAVDDCSCIKFTTAPLPAAGDDEGRCPALDCGHVCHWGLKCPEPCGCIGIPGGLTLEQAEAWSRKTGATETQVKEAVAAYRIAISYPSTVGRWPTTRAAALRSGDES